MAQDPPVARRLPVERTAHGEVVVDAYAWMRNRESEDVLSHLRVENEYTERALAHLADLRETLFREIKSRIKETDLSVPEAGVDARLRLVDERGASLTFVGIR